MNGCIPGGKERIREGIGDKFTWSQFGFLWVSLLSDRSSG